MCNVLMVAFPEEVLPAAPVAEERDQNEDVRNATDAADEANAAFMEGLDSSDDDDNEGQAGAAQPSANEPSMPTSSSRVTVNTLWQMMQDGEQIAELKLPHVQKVCLAFDAVFDLLDELDRWDWDDSSDAGRALKANKVAEMANRAERIFRVAYDGPCQSDYADIGQHVMPKSIRKHGKDFLRANEQAQEQAGQNIKKRRRNGNKRGRIGTYQLFVKKKKQWRTCIIKQTRNEHSLVNEELKNEACHRVVSRYTCKTRGGQIQQLLRDKPETGSIKRERVYFTPLLIEMLAKDCLEGVD